MRRDLRLHILRRLGEVAERRAVLILGPRQVGKTVLLLQLADDLLAKRWLPQNLTYFDFADDRIA